MCNFKSFVVTRNKIFFSNTSESHEGIMREFNLYEGQMGAHPNLVRVELRPYSITKNTPFNQFRKWLFRVDQDIIPRWFDRKDVRERVIRVMEKEYKNCTSLNLPKEDLSTSTIVFINHIATKVFLVKLPDDATIQNLSIHERYRLPKKLVATCEVDIWAKGQVVPSAAKISTLCISASGVKIPKTAKIDTINFDKKEYIKFPVKDNYNCQRVCCTWRDIKKYTKRLIFAH
jgi:hypothetical protein